MSTKSRHAKWMRRQLARIAAEDSVLACEIVYSSGPWCDMGTHFEQPDHKSDSGLWEIGFGSGKLREMPDPKPK